MLRYLVPLGVFGLLIVVFLFGLQTDPRKIPSVLIDKPVPEFQLQDLHDPGVLLSVNDLPDKPFLLNVWASWCAACLTEHPLLLVLSEQADIDIYGLNYKDTREDALAWLNEHGNPYQQSLFDNSGSMGIELGVYGVPETFIIDSQGIIRYKHIGPVTSDSLRDEILPRMETLTGSPDKVSP